ncbi:MAG: hypothetical protein MUF54_13845 [Polyangiaceae bacterium]|jgi:hypothetical protein|nr:hypothetical protein [Polyangiaceae bacterium]
MIAGKRWALLVAFSAGLAATGCGDDDTDTEGGGPSPGALVDLGGQFVDSVTQAPVEGFEICTLVPSGRVPGCAMTDAQGKILATGFPTNSKVLFTGKKDGVQPILISGMTTTQNSTNALILTMTEESVNAIMTASNLTLEPGKGAIVIFAGDEAGSDLVDATGNGLAGVSFTVTPTATAAYLKGGSPPVLDAAATETDSTGWAALLNLEPDTEYTVKFNHASKSCAMETGYPGSSPDERKVPTMAGTFSYIIAGCQ